MSYRPLFDRVLLQLEAVGDRSAGGLYIPSVAEGSQPVTAIVKGVGPGRFTIKGTEPIDLKVGDRVLVFPKNCVELPGYGDKLFVVSADHILAVEE
jgi:chaperonin GroES